jgi:hypothetical protein
MAKAKASTTTRRSQNSLRAKAAQQRRNQTMIIGAAAAVFVFLIGFVIYLQVRSTLPVAGEEVFASLGNTHIEFGSQFANYNSTPPTSGPHYDNLVGWGIYDEPQRYEHLVHNLEDGGVIVYYQCADDCPDLKSELEAVIQPYVSRGDHVIMLPNDPTWSINGSQPLHSDMGATIAVTAWQHMLKLDTVDTEKIRTFIDRYEGIDHHVAGIG